MATTKYYTKWPDDMDKKEEDKDLMQMKTLRRRQKGKAHTSEIQLNSGHIADEDNFARDHYEEILVGDVLAQDEVTQKI